MRKLKDFILVIVLSLGLSSLFSAPENNTPVGYWKTIDEDTKEVKSVVKIWKTKDNMIKGEIIKIFPEPGEDPNPVCDECEGEKKNKPILGMEFMWGFEGVGEKWENGKILYPENGKVYNCNLEVIDDGNKMKVFGYIKLLVKIGRTQIWHRTEKPEEN